MEDKDKTMRMIRMRQWTSGMIKGSLEVEGLRDREVGFWGGSEISILYFICGASVLPFWWLSSHVHWRWDPTWSDLYSPRKDSNWPCDMIAQYWRCFPKFVPHLDIRRVAGLSMLLLFEYVITFQNGLPRPKLIHSCGEIKRVHLYGMTEIT